MKNNRKQTIAKIKDVTFKNRSVYGNPSYYILFENEEGEEIQGYTKPNADCAYGCKNEELREFAYIEYHVTKSGKIVINQIFNKSTYERLFANQK